MSPRRLGRILVWTLRVAGAALVVYAPIAILGPVQELAPPHGPLHCHGSALTLRNRASIPRDPGRDDCRSQAEDQTSGAVTSFLVGAAMIGGPPLAAVRPALSGVDVAGEAR